MVVGIRVLAQQGCRSGVAARVWKAKVSGEALIQKPRKVNTQDRLLSQSDGDHDGGGNVCRNLEPRELANGIVDTTAPRYSLNDRSEVVHESNIGSLLSDLGTSNTHGESDVSGVEGGTIIRTTAGDIDGPTEREEGFNGVFLSLGEDRVRT